jgi:glycosyltransferase involved in cell wall biosynthesis
MNNQRVLLIHNYYQHSGGEDAVFALEKSLLMDHGHTVFEYTDSNKRIESLGYINSAVQTIWSQPSYNAIKRILQDVKPDIAHFHNTFMLVSPSAYYACVELGVPVIQTLHNYRLVCPNAYLFRDGAICEECIDLKNPFPGVFHKCYRDSYSQSAVVAGMLGAHWLFRTWQNKIDFYIALSEFARQKFIQGGLPENKIIVKPNFVTDINVPQRTSVGEYVLYVGRLSSEKGLDTLFSAWDRLKIPLKIAGDGPLREYVQKYAEKSPFIEYLGQVNQKSIGDLLRRACFVIFPSKWYEGLPMTIIESFAYSVPVIAANLPARAELIRDAETGLLYTAGDVADLAAKVEWLWNHPESCVEMGRKARVEYEEKYTPELNYQILRKIYQMAMENRTQNI